MAVELGVSAGVAFLEADVGMRFDEAPELGFGDSEPLRPRAMPALELVGVAPGEVCLGPFLALGGLGVVRRLVIWRLRCTKSIVCLGAGLVPIQSPKFCRHD